MKEGKIIGKEINANVRASERTNGFLAATIEVFDKKWPVRLKNISLTGALVNTQNRFAVGTTITLHRLHFSITGVVVREGINYLALSFDKPITPEIIDCLKASANKAKSTRPSDELWPASHAAKPCPVSGLRPSHSPLDGRLAKELQYAQSLLKCISEPIANDHALMQRHGRNMQVLYSINQLLRDIAKIIATQDKECAINQIENPELRLRLKDGLAENQFMKK